MNYSGKKSDKVLLGLFSGIAKAGMIVLTAFLLCGSIDKIPEEDNPTYAEQIVIQEEQTEPCVEEADDGFINPTTEGVLTSTFGDRWGRNHDGIDIGADENSNIYAVDDGTVTCAQYVNGYGNYIEITHDNGFETAYAHCNSIVVKVGDRVEKGQLIAYVGSTGNSTGPHLHFEVKVNGELLNPLDYVVY